MIRAKVLPAFTEPEQAKAHRLLAIKVALMMGRKFEEGDWAQVYCAAKGIPLSGWSNLNLDIVHGCLGVEQKMLRPSGDRPVRNVFGARLMHPSATRSIRVLDGPAEMVMQDVLTQYGHLIEQRKRAVKAACGKGEPDLRTGWLLWQSNLREFLYFEEETLTPVVDDYIAEWHENEGKGARKPSKSLWIYEKETGQKKYSVTTSAGAKIQPYFDVPPQSHPHVYVFRVQGEEIEPGLIRVWAPSALARELERLLGGLTPEQIETALRRIETRIAEARTEYLTEMEDATPFTMTSDAYNRLWERFPNAVGDAHLVQLVLEELTK